MAGEGWQEATLYDEKGERLLAQVHYVLSRTVEADGYLQLAGSFALREEISPLHTGPAELVSRHGENWLVRVLRISRPEGTGDLEVVGPVGPTSTEE